MTDLHQSELAFLGRITAGVTHEFKNVLATINESAGLIQDLMAISREIEPYHDKFQKAFAGIRNQVQRGQSLAAQLNHFAHAADRAIRSVDLVETAVHLIALSQRFAAMKKVTLRVVSPDSAEKPLLATTNAVQFQLALFTAIECWLELASPGNEIDLIFSRKENDCAALLSIRGDFPAATDVAGSLKGSEKWLLLQEVTRHLGGRTAITEDAPGILLIMPGPVQPQI